MVGIERSSVRFVRSASPNSRRARPEHDRVDLQDVAVDQPAGVQGADQLATAQDRQVVATCCLSAPTVSTASPASKVEFG